MLAVNTVNAQYKTRHQYKKNNNGKCRDGCMGGKKNLTETERKINNVSESRFVRSAAVSSAYVVNA